MWDGDGDSTGRGEEATLRRTSSSEVSQRMSSPRPPQVTSGWLVPIMRGFSRCCAA